MPLTYRDRGSSGTQVNIVSGTAVLGSLWKAVLSVTVGQEARWNWTWHAGPASGPQSHGTADTVEEAKAQLEEQWRAWLEAAGLVECAHEALFEHDGELRLRLRPLSRRSFPIRNGVVQNQI